MTDVLVEKLCELVRVLDVKERTFSPERDVPCGFNVWRIIAIGGRIIGGSITIEDEVCSDG